MNRFISNRSILFVFISIFVAITVFASLSIFFVFQFRLTNIVLSEKHRDTLNTSRDISMYIQNSLDSELNIVKGVSNSMNAFETMTNTEKENYIQDVLNDSSYLHSIEILDENFIVTDSFPNDNNYRVGYDMSYFIQNMGYQQNLDYVWSNPYTTPAIDELVISLVYNQDNHYVFTTYSLTFFDDIYTTLKTNSTDSNLMILDQYGIYVFDSEGDGELQRIRYVDFDKIRYDLSDDRNHIDIINGKETIASTTYVESQNWYVVYYESTSAALSFFSDITIVVLLTIVGLILIYLFGILHSMSIVKNSINVVYESMKKVTDGNYGLILEDIRFKEFQDIKREFNDMSVSLEQSTSRLKNLAYYDQLTSMRSRAYLIEYFDLEFKNKESIVCLYIDINRFQLINDSYGYNFGNEVIKKFTQRLSQLPLGTVNVYKSEGDEFIMILSDYNSKENLSETISYIISLLKKPLFVNEVDVILETTIGAAIWDDNTKSIEQLITQAIIGMNDAKKENYNMYSIYNPSKSAVYQRRLEIEMSIDNAIENQEFTVVLHPIVFTNSKQIRGFEALSRWHHQTMGLIGPVEYISIFERAKKVHLLDIYVLGKSLEFLAELDDDYVMSVNLSVETIIWPGFISKVKELLQMHNVKPSLLELEVTESTIVEDYKEIQKIMNALRKIGVRFSEDDFGDGFSALNYLSKLDLNTLKISKNLTDDLGKNKSSETLVRHIIALANELNLDTIIEGVETKEVYDICKTLKCDFIQGFYFYKPLDFNQVKKLLQKSDIENN